MDSIEDSFRPRKRSMAEKYTALNKPLLRDAIFDDDGRSPYDRLFNKSQYGIDDYTNPLIKEWRDRMFME